MYEITAFLRAVSGRVSAQNLLTDRLSVYIYSSDTAWYRARYQAKYRVSTIPLDSAWYRQFVMPVSSEPYCSHPYNHCCAAMT